MSYVVYRHTSPSGKVYIGVTCQKPNDRWNSGRNYKNNLHFSRAIQKYGWDNFEHKILFDGLSKLDAELIEIDLIYYYKKLGISYNITDGGDGVNGFRHSLESRRKMSESHKELHNVPWNKGKTGYTQPGRAVLQYDLDGNFIREWESLSSAAKSCNKCVTSLWRVCAGTRKTCGGYVWRYKN